MKSREWQHEGQRNVSWIKDTQFILKETHFSSTLVSTVSGMILTLSGWDGWYFQWVSKKRPAKRLPEMKMQALRPNVLKIGGIFHWCCDYVSDEARKASKRSNSAQKIGEDKTEITSTIRIASCQLARDERNVSLKKDTWVTYVFSCSNPYHIDHVNGNERMLLLESQFIHNWHWHDVFKWSFRPVMVICMYVVQLYVCPT